MKNSKIYSLFIEPPVSQAGLELAMWSSWVTLSVILLLSPQCQDYQHVCPGWPPFFLNLEAESAL